MEKANRISLKDVPQDVLMIIIEEKAELMKRTGRVNVSFSETLYKVIREWAKQKS